MEKVVHKYDTPTVTQFRKAQDVVDRFYETPKYKGLSLEDGDAVDKLLYDVAPKLQVAYQRQTGAEMSRGLALITAIQQGMINDPDVARFILANFGPRLSIRRRHPKRRSLGAADVMNPERDAILMENQSILSRFYPDLLQKQLNREQEAGLTEPAFAAVYQ